VPGHGDGDLVSEVQSLLRELERSSELETHLVVSGSPLPRLGESQDVLVSVVNEALSNVERHARAGTVLISIRYEDDRLDLVIQDDGVGVPDLVLNTFPDSYLHFGLRHMRQRIVEFGGTFEVGNGEEAGTIIRVSLPVSEAAG
jgi:signal transduction histidine kinase